MKRVFKKIIISVVTLMALALVTKSAWVLLPLIVFLRWLLTELKGEYKRPD